MSEVLHKYLRSYLGKQIIAVTADGGGYMGVLVEFDDKFMILKDVYESTTATALTWHKVELESPVIVEDNSITGDFQSKLTLTSVILNLNQVIRIWPT